MPYYAKSLMELVMSEESYMKKVIDLQAEFARRLAVRESVVPQNISLPVLSLVQSCDAELMEMLLGPVGVRLKTIVNSVDPAHPEIGILLDGAFTDENLSSYLSELVAIGQFAREKNLTRVAPLLGQAVMQDAFGKNIIKKIESPSRMYVRLLNNKIDREEVRSTKKTQVIDLGAVERKGEDCWRSQPDDFRRFLRFDTAYKEEIEKAERRAARYTAMGCTSLAQEILKSAEEFKQTVEQSYYGFNRITMTNAAVIVARSLGFSFQQGDFSVYGMGGKIVVHRHFFSGYNFDSDFIPLTYYDRQPPPFDYEPRVYPLHEFISLAPPGVIETISTLDSFPDAGGKPIFDHFGLIVPSIKFFPEKAEGFSFLDENGLKRFFVERDEAVKQLDMALVRNKYFYPVLIGERDGRCYFISFFQ